MLLLNLVNLFFKATGDKPERVSPNRKTIECTKYKYLACIVEGEPEEEDVGEGFNNAEEPVNNPIGQPLRVVLFITALNGLDAEQTHRVSSGWKQKLCISILTSFVRK